MQRVRELGCSGGGGCALESVRRSAERQGAESLPTLWLVMSTCKVPAEWLMEPSVCGVKETVVVFVRSGLPEEWWDCAMERWSYLRNDNKLDHDDSIRDEIWPNI